MFRPVVFVALLLCGGLLFALTGQLIKVTRISGPDYCAYGGQEIAVGFDNGTGNGIADNLVLEDGEITGFSYICNGEPGTTVKDIQVTGGSGCSLTTL